MTMMMMMTMVMSTMMMMTMVDYADDDDDDDTDDNDVLTLAHFSEILPAVTKTGCSKNAHSMAGNKNKYLVRKSAHGSIIPVREGNGANEPWYNTIPYHL